MMQLDLFAAPVAPPPMTALGAVEILCQGDATPERMMWGSGGLQIRLFRHPDGYDMDSNYSAHHVGGCGPSNRCGAQARFPDRDAALIHAARWAIRRCAHDEAMADGWSDYARSAKDYLAMVKWFADLLPPLLSGFDAMAELGAMRPLAIAKETARRAELMRVHQAQEKITEAIRDVDAYGYPNLVQDGKGWLATFSSDEDGTVVLTPHAHASAEKDGAERLAAMLAALQEKGHPARLAA